MGRRGEGKGEGKGRGKEKGKGVCPPSGEVWIRPCCLQITGSGNYAIMI